MPVRTSRARSTRGTANGDTDHDAVPSPAKRKRMENDSFSGQSQSDSQVETERPRAKLRRRRNSSTRGSLNPGDWSQVLGTAALTSGWSSAVIDRAARRCAGLFGEGMALRTLPVFPSAPSLNIYTPEMDGLPRTIRNFAAASSKTGEGVNVCDVETDGMEAVEEMPWVCPYTDCKRHYHPFQHPFRWREHLKRIHLLTTDEIAAKEAGIRGPDRSGKTESRRWTPPDTLTCPLGGCKLPDKVYASRRLLLQHMRRWHGWVPTSTSAEGIVEAERPADAESDARTASNDGDVLTNKTGTGNVTDLEPQRQANIDEEMLDGVHLDGFLQPVTGIIRRASQQPVKRKPWSRGRRAAFERRRKAGSEPSGSDGEGD